MSHFLHTVTTYLLTKSICALICALARVPAPPPPSSHPVSPLLNPPCSFLIKYELRHGEGIIRSKNNEASGAGIPWEDAGTHKHTQKRTAKKNRNGFVTARQARAIQPSVKNTGQCASRGASKRERGRNKKYKRSERTPGGASNRRRPCGPKDRGRAVGKTPIAARLTGRPLALLCSILILRRDVVLDMSSDHILHQIEELK